MAEKQLKDPIYGYVKIDEETVRNIVDTPMFQRLRNIRQTSYAPLYPSAVHNRFLHSIGVYFLARKAFGVLLQQETINDAKNFEKLGDDFIKACLLHDVGHAPFSHIGEHFYSLEKMADEMRKEIGDENFDSRVKEMETKGMSAAQHEMMSVIIGLKEFGKSINDKDFFARCILGYKYTSHNKGINLDEKYQFKNCLVELLNSKTIDLDKLDYIVRDAFVTGFESVAIDYERLINSLKICRNKGEFVLAFHKSALGIIENVIYAHDSGRKWIQNHPTVRYENFIVEHMIRIAERHFHSTESRRLFSSQSLSVAGSDFSEKGKISLLADEDIIFVTKNLVADDLSREFSYRNKRRHPIWKSEAEYQKLFEGSFGSSLLNKVEARFSEIEKIFESLSIKQKIINGSFKNACNEELTKLDDNFEIEDIDKNGRKCAINRVLGLIGCLEGFAGKNGIPLDFVVIFASKFKSSFMKKELEEMLIVFDDEEPKHIRDVSSVLKSDETSRDKFFYVYCHRRSDEEKISGRAFLKHLLEYATENLL